MAPNCSSKEKEKERIEEEKKKKEKGRREEEENQGFEISYVMFGTYAWNSCFEFMLGIPFLYGITINLSLCKLCRKNPIRSVVGWYKMSFIVYFEF